MLSSNARTRAQAVAVIVGKQCEAPRSMSGVWHLSGQSSLALTARQTLTQKRSYLPILVASDTNTGHVRTRLFRPDGPSLNAATHHWAGAGTGTSETGTCPGSLSAHPSACPVFPRRLLIRCWHTTSHLSGAKGIMFFAPHGLTSTEMIGPFLFSIDYFSLWMLTSRLSEQCQCTDTSRPFVKTKPSL
jgi:hypothetical protein